MLVSISCYRGNRAVEEETGRLTENIIASPDTALEYNMKLEEIIEHASRQWFVGNFRDGLAHFSVAYKLAKDKEDEHQMAVILNNLGLLYWSLNDDEAAMECYNEATPLAEKLSLKRLLGLLHTNKGLVLRKQKQYEEALEQNNIAIDIFKETEIPRDLAIAYNNHGQIFKVQKQMDSALYYYNKALDIYHLINYKDGMSATYHNLSEIYASKGLEAEALNAARISLQKGMEVGSSVRVEDAYKNLSTIHEHFSHFDSALIYQKKYAESKTETLLSTYSKQLAEYETEMRTEIKNLRIENLEKEKTIAINRMWLSISIFILVLLMVTFFVYRKLHRARVKKRRLELELENSQKILHVKELELKSYIVDLAKKNRMLNELQAQLAHKAEDDDKTSNVAQLLNQKILTDDDWKTFKEKFSIVYPHFFARIKQYDVHISEAEARFLVLFKLDLSGKEMANMLGISPQSVRALKMRMKKKLNRRGYDSVEDFVARLGVKM